MQNYPHRFFKTRTNYCLYKLMDNHVPKGEQWKKMKKDIPPLIGIFVVGEKMEDLDTAVTVTAECDLATGEVFWDRMRKYFISLPHVEEELCESPSVKELWLNFFKNLDKMKMVDEKLLVNADEGLLKLVRKANTAALTDEEYRQYEAWMKEYMDEGAAEGYGYYRGHKEGVAEGMKKGLAKGRAEGLSKGMEKGRAEGFKEAVLLMIGNGKTVEEVAALLNLSVEKVQGLME